MTRGFVSRHFRRACSLACLLLANVACGESTDSTSLSPGSMSGSGGEQQDPDQQAGQDCFENPTNHFELINACTKAVRVERSPMLLLLEPDGSLPPP